jgi:histidinol-phosphate aminotransferase
MKCIRDTIARLEPYIPGKQIDASAVKLNTNENPYPPSPRVKEALNGITDAACRLYPDARANPVREAAATAFSVRPEEIVVGNGSDDVLTMIMRTFLDPGDRIAVGDPTYTLYGTLAAMQAAETCVFPLADDFSLPDEFFRADVKLAFLPNPNAQTGTLFPRETVERLCAACPGIVVVDEAYASFAGMTVIDLIRTFDNLIVTRTLSKSHSLAGLRIGFGIACSETIEYLMKVKDSYNVNAVSQAAALAALTDEEYVAETVAKVIATRTWFGNALCDREWTVVDSAANFILASPPGCDPASMVATLEQRGFLVRYFNTPRLRPFLRISMGTDEQMQALLQCLDDICI